MRITESRLRQIIREELLREGGEEEDLMMKFIEAQKKIADKFRNPTNSQKPSPVDNVRVDLAGAASKINDEFNRVGFDIGEYMEALAAALEEAGAPITFNIDDYSEESPVSSIEWVRD